MSLLALVLAAGAGTRFGGGKLSAPFRGEPLVFHAIRAARAAPVARVLVVCAPDLETGAWSGGPEVARIPMASDALSTTLKAGIAAAARDDAAGVFIFLGDMPLVPHEVAGRLAAELGEAFAAVPRCNGRSGHPVLLSARAFGDVARLEGDRGAGGMIRGRSDVVFLDVADEAILLDVDRVEDLARLEKRAR